MLLCGENLQRKELIHNKKHQKNSLKQILKDTEQIQKKDMCFIEHIKIEFKSTK
jgi:hypothetical protein